MMIKTLSLAASLLVAGTLALPAATLAATPAAEGTVDRASPKAFVKDSVITTKIKTELAAEKISSLVHISVDTDNKGAVVLTGTAKTRAAADKAVSIAHGVKGVVSVQDDIKIVADK